MKTVIAFLLLALPNVGLAQASAPEAARIVVAGSSTQTTTPDAVTVTIGARAREGASRFAVGEASRLAEAVVAALGALDLADLEVERIGFGVAEVLRYDDDRAPRLDGYRASTSVRVKTATVGAVGSIVEAATGAEGTIDAIRYSSADMDALREAALREATLAARADAEVLAEAAGGRLGRLLLITTNQLDRQVGVYGPVAIGLAGIQESGRASVVITPEPIAVTVTVEGRWEFVPDRSDAD